MSYLRAVTPAPVSPSGARSCLDVFQDELPYIFRTLRRLGAYGPEVEDLVQDVFLALRHSWSHYDSARPVRPYLFGIAFRVFSSHRRKLKREVPLDVTDIDDPDDAGPDGALEAKQARALLMAGLECVPLPRRAVLIMHEMDDLPVVEIAGILAIPLFTVYSRLRTARKELEEAIVRLTRETAA